MRGIGHLRGILWAAGACVFPTTTCGSPSCSGKAYVGVGTCGAGEVRPAEREDLPGDYACEANACATTCSADADSVAGYFCDGGTCSVKATAVSCGQHSCALLFDGTLRCWGSNTYGELGNGATSSLPVKNPVAITGVPPIAVGVAVRGFHTCAVFTSGEVWCWGYNSSGQLGNGTTTNSSVPVKVAGLGKGATGVAVGDTFSCAILTDGSIACWGSDYYGVLGDGNSPFTPVLSPVPVPGLPGPVSSLALSNDNGCATISGELYCWGFNGVGEIGNGKQDGSIYKATDTGVPSAGGAEGDDFGCALNGGYVECWGLNNDGQVGDGSITTTSPGGVPTPTFVSGLGSGAIVGLAAGTDFACALNVNGGVLCWGNNAQGQLGTGSLSPSDSPTPVPVSKLANVSAISAGCALLPDGSVWQWGGSVGATPLQVPGW